MTAAERLIALAGQTGTAAALLLLIGTGATAGDTLVDYSGLETGTAAQHLLADQADHQSNEVHGGGKKSRWSMSIEDVQKHWELLDLRNAGQKTDQAHEAPVVKIELQEAETPIGETPAINNPKERIKLEVPALQVIAAKPAQQPAVKAIEIPDQIEVMALRKKRDEEALMMILLSL
jgi:hypothetical protein